MVTAAALFDGHDASINVMRRLLQSRGVEVVHLAHDRSAKDVVEAAVQEDVHAVALTSYQGGHMEYLRYVRKLLDDAGCPHVRIFAGGGGTITPDEIEELNRDKIARVYSPEDGRRMGLMGMIDDVVATSREADSVLGRVPSGDLSPSNPAIVARHLTLSQTGERKAAPAGRRCKVLGITGVGGAGKSSLTDELLRRMRRANPDLRVGLLCADPSMSATGGALLGDRIRMNALDQGMFFRSLATRGAGEVPARLADAVEVMQEAGYDLILVESSGIGQASNPFKGVADVTAYVMTPEFGAETQLEKIEMLHAADLVVVNKCDRRGGDDALRAVRRQVRRNRMLLDAAEHELPVVGTIGNAYAHSSIDDLYGRVAELCGLNTSTAGLERVPGPEVGETIVPAERTAYLREIATCVRKYHSDTREAAAALERAHALALAGDITKDAALGERAAQERAKVKKDVLSVLDAWPKVAEQYRGKSVFEYKVRDRVLTQPLTKETLAGTQVPRVALPTARERAPALLLEWLRKEHLPGHFPYTAGNFPLKRTDEAPTRQFAGEGSAARTNERFHLLSKDSVAKRLSTAFDSVTLYGRDPAHRPDIFGKVGNSGVAIFTVEEMERLFQGFDLCDPQTSVSKTINGPAPAILAMFFTAAIRQQERKAEAAGEVLDDAKRAEIRARTLKSVRGTVQADILKEDQGQNTCIFSTEFALKLMGDCQQFYIDNGIKNHYSVSISGYHIAEAGANPITQLALTLANGFTYVEYYLSRGMHIDDFAPSLSYFFSNGLDTEYTVIGRVARRIWAVAMREKYGANARSQLLKYHIQTSGRSLHAQEMQFNDIRTTLQALIAVQDQCNSLHTNAYDEAITTPTAESLRRAMAIQLIVNQEAGWNFCENPMQGSHFVEELTDLVEEAVLQEFERIDRRGGVLGAMETMYQRGKIQEESLHYEEKKHDGSLPLIGVNCFLDPEADTAAEIGKIELRRSTDEEKEECIQRLEAFHAKHKDAAEVALKRLQDVALAKGNIFEELMRTVEVCSLGQITDTLFKCGGQYRRNM